MTEGLIPNKPFVDSKEKVYKGMLESLEGFVHWFNYPQMRDGIGLMFRHSLGYVHPNTLHMNVLMLSMMIIYLCSSGLNEVKQIKKRDRVIRLVALDILVFAYNVYVFFYSGSRTGLLAAAVYVFVSFWFFMRPVPGIVEKAACYAAYPVVCFISVVLPFILPDGIFEKIDRTVFNTRLTIARYFMSNNRISLFGIRLNNPLPEYRTYGLDMSHMYLFLQLGLVAFVMIGMFTMGFVHLALRKGMMAELAVLLGTLFAGIWEPYLYNLGFKNFTYVFMGTLLYELTSESEDHLYAKSDSDSWIFGFRIGEALCLRRLLITAAVGMLTGCIAASVYLAATDVPSALYADLSEDESGVGFGMEELYLSPEEISQLRSDGNLVVGYADGKTPMYKYDSGIAVSEYHKRALSVGVWTGLAFAAAGALDKNRGTGRDE